MQSEPEMGIGFSHKTSLKNGASEAEIVEALDVAISVNAGAALVYSARVLDAFHTKTEPTPAV